MRVLATSSVRSDASIRWTRLAVIVLTTLFFTGSFSGASAAASADVASQSDHTHGTHGDVVSASQIPHLNGPEYSMFMHHSSGLVLMVIALLLMVDRLRLCPHAVTTVLIGSTWLLFGVFLFIKSDPDEWPISLSFMESWHRPVTRNEWIQHKLLSLIPILLGAYTLSARRGGQPLIRTYAAAGAALLGGMGLLIHQHFDHPEFDVVNFQHRLFALTAMCVAGGLIIERLSTITWKAKPFVVPIAILLLGVQLMLYVE